MSGEWENFWNAKMAAFERLFGPSDDEVEFCRKEGSDVLLNLLRRHDVFPYTDLLRESVLDNNRDR